MVAALSIRVYTSTNAATESSAVTGVDFISADNATNSLANRQANPIVAGANSYEKWIKAKVDTAPANTVSNFKVWGDGATQANTTLKWIGERVTGVTPVSTASSIATTTFTTCTSGAKCTWDTTSYTSIGNTTKYQVFQLQVGSTATQGNWTQEVISWSYDET
jgi:hypothetical protein